MLRGQVNRSERISLTESRLFDQPGRGRFNFSSRSRVPRQPTTGDRLQLRKLLFCDDWILEERSGAAGIWISFDEQHRFTPANAAHSVANFGQSRVRDFTFEFTLKLGITNGGMAVIVQRICYVEHGVTIFRRGVEQTCPIREAAFIAGEFDNAIGASVVCANANEYFRN